jgi:Uncharacterized protein conserved in bacteria
MTAARAVLLLLLALYFPAPTSAETSGDMLMGAVVKSDKWKINRTDNTETFTGDVSFRNNNYNLKSDDAVYRRGPRIWDISGSVYTLRKFDDGSTLEMRCAKARYFEINELTTLKRGALPVRMRYKSADGIINGSTNSSTADNKAGTMKFNGKFSLSTDNISLYSAQGLYTRDSDSFLLTDTKPPTEGFPMSVGTREGYDFAIRAENVQFFKTSRDAVFYKKVSGWIKDIPIKNAKKNK